MTLQYNVPGGYAQWRTTFSVDGLTDPMGFTMGVFSSTLAYDLVNTNVAIKFRDEVLEAGALMGTHWRWLGSSLTWIAPGGPITYESPASMSGTAAVETVPPNSAVLVRKQTALGGRRNRGRLFMPPCTTYETQVDSAGFMAGATVAAVNIRWEDWRTTCEAIDCFFYLYHQYDPDLGELPEVPTQITGLAVQPQLATQRNRMR